MRKLAKLISSIFKTERVLLDRYPILQTNILNDINNLTNVLENPNISFIEKIDVENVIIDPKPTNINKTFDKRVILNFKNNSNIPITFPLNITITNAIAFSKKNVSLIFIPRYVYVVHKIFINDDFSSYYTFYYVNQTLQLKTPIQKITIIIENIYICPYCNLSFPFPEIYFKFEI